MYTVQVQCVYYTFIHMYLYVHVVLYRGKFWIGANLRIFHMMPHHTKKTEKIFVFEILSRQLRTGKFPRGNLHID